MIIDALSENFNDRKGEIDMIVLHSMTQSVEEGIKRLNRRKLSCHYIVAKDGRVYRLVPDEKRSWHAGISFWKDKNRDINDRSIGIEISNPGLGKIPYTPEQMKATIILCRKLMQKHNIPQHNIVGHSDIAPLRKSDPGKFFFWKELAESGVGLKFNSDDAKKIRGKTPAELLGQIGYDVKDRISAKASLYAFKKRYVPEKANEVIDISRAYNLSKKAKELLLPNLVGTTERAKTVLKRLRYKRQNIDNCNVANTLKAVAYAYEKSRNNEFSKDRRLTIYNLQKKSM